MELSQQASVPLSAPTVDSLLNGSNMDPSMSAAFGSGSQNQFDSEKQQRKQQVLARREELRQKAVGGDDASAPLAAPPAQQTPVYTQPPTQTAAPVGLRDDLIRGAVDFLTHPRVAGSDPEKKRRFLKSKGLTDEEIIESFKRAGSLAGATPVAAAAPMTYAAPQGAQQMVPQQYQQPRPYGAVMPPPPPPPQIVVQSPSLRALAFIVLICAGIGSAITYLIRRYVIPYFWPRKKPQEEKLEKLQQEIAATSAVVQEQAEDIRDALSIIKNFLQSQVDASVDTKSLEETRQRQEAAKVSELKREIGAIKNLLPVSAFAPSWKRNTTSGPHLGSEFLEDFYDIKGEITDIKRALGNSRSSPPASLEGSATGAPGTSPPSSSSAPGSAPVERAGSKRGLPAWMQAQPSIPSWQLTDGQSETGTSSPPLSTTPPQSTTPPRSTTPPPASAPAEQPTNASGGEPPMSQDFMNILQMVQAGKTPPNVRTDIDDKPSDPNAPITAGQVAPRPKPWQKRGLPEDAAANDLYQQQQLRSSATSN